MEAKLFTLETHKGFTDFSLAIGNDYLEIQTWSIKQFEIVLAIHVKLVGTTVLMCSLF